MTCLPIDPLPLDDGLASYCPENLMEAQEHDPTAPQPEGPAWRATLEGKWDDLRRQVLGLDPKAQRKMADLGQECQSLAAVVAWYEAKGNITHAAERLGTSRRALRGRIAKWRMENPQAPLPPLATEAKPSVQEGRAQGQRIASEEP